MITAQTVWNRIWKRWISFKLPLTIVNTRLPKSCLLSDTWYRSKPFNRRSAIMYDFILDHQMALANFAFQQSAHYTYKKGECISYIDHMLIPCYMMNQVIDCKILNNEYDNIRDRYPLKLCMSVKVPKFNNNYSRIM